jgi:hypothetical protein
LGGLGIRIFDDRNGRTGWILNATLSSTSLGWFLSGLGVRIILAGGSIRLGATTA